MLLGAEIGTRVLCLPRVSALASTAYGVLNSGTGLVSFCQLLFGVVGESQDMSSLGLVPDTCPPGPALEYGSLTLLSGCQDLFLPACVTTVTFGWESDGGGMVLTGVFTLPVDLNRSGDPVLVMTIFKFAPSGVLFLSLLFSLFFCCFNQFL